MANKSRFGVNVSSPKYWKFEFKSGEDDLESGTVVKCSIEIPVSELSYVYKKFHDTLLERIHSNIKNIEKAKSHNDFKLICPFCGSPLHIEGITLMIDCDLNDVKSKNTDVFNMKHELFIERPINYKFKKVKKDLIELFNDIEKVFSDRLNI